LRAARWQQATTKPAAKNPLQQQALFDELVHECHFERPHRVLDTKRPGDLYQPTAGLSGPA